MAHPSKGGAAKLKTYVVGRGGRALEKRAGR